MHLRKIEMMIRMMTKNDKEEIASDYLDYSTKDIGIGDEASYSSIQEDDNLDRSMKGGGIKHNSSNNGSSSLQQEQSVSVPRRSSRLFY